MRVPTLAVLGLILLIQGPNLLGFWIGHPMRVEPAIVIGLTLTFVLRAWVDCRSVIFNSAGFLRQPLYYWSVQAILNVSLSLILVRQVGVAGVAWAGAISALLTTFWGYPLMMKQFFKSAEDCKQTQTNP
jgi:Na+-driven multidrug efflux pump